MIVRWKSNKVVVFLWNFYAFDHEKKNKKKTKDKTKKL